MSVETRAAPYPRITRTGPSRGGSANLPHFEGWRLEKGIPAPTAKEAKSPEMIFNVEELKKTANGLT